MDWSVLWVSYIRITCQTIPVLFYFDIRTYQDTLLDLSVLLLFASVTVSVFWIVTIKTHNYNTPVKDLTYKDLLTSTLILSSHERGIKTWCVPATYPECVYWGKMDRYERFNVECHVDPNIGNSTGKERTDRKNGTCRWTQSEFVECWSETIIRNGLPPTLVDGPLFRKTLVTTSRMGQTVV